jgi:germination protein M
MIIYKSKGLFRWRCYEVGKILRISLLYVFLLLALTGCGNKQKANVEQQPSEKSVKIFLSNKEKNSWINKDVNISSVNNEDIVTEIFEILQTGIEDELDTITTVPSFIRLLEVKLEKSNLILNVSEEYYKLDTVEENLCRVSLISSLTELDFVEKVEIYVEGMPLKGPDGKALGSIGKDQLVFDDPENESKTLKKVLLYFSDKEGLGLVPEEVQVEVNPNEPLEKTVLNLLINGPLNDTEVRTIPAETKVISTSISEGVCYVDFSKEFQAKHTGGSTGELLTIYSIVNTLTELPDINKVQFLIEGEKEELFKGHLQFNILFERNLDLVLDNNKK